MLRIIKVHALKFSIFIQDSYLVLFELAVGSVIIKNKSYAPSIFVIVEHNLDLKARESTSFLCALVFASQHLRIARAIISTEGVLESGFGSVGDHDKMDEDTLDDETSGHER